MASGVVPLARVMSTAAAPLVLIEPLAVVIVLLLSVACNPSWPALGVTVTAPKVIAPVLVARRMPAPPEEVELVVPKLSDALDVSTLMPAADEPLMVVEPLDIAPATPVRLTPVAALPLDEMLVKAAVAATGPLRVPLLRLSA